MKVFIFVPGYYGTSLKNPENNQLVWGDPLEVLLGRNTLATPVKDLPIPGLQPLEPHHLIPDVKLLGGLIKEESYDKTVALLKKVGGKDNVIIPVPWDWRKDPLLGVQRIHQTVIEAKKKYPQAPLVLVSHSFGSLIAAYYLRYGTQDYFDAKESWSGLQNFSKVIMSAAPFRGLMAAFRNMHRGIRIGLNTKAQSPLALSTFESSYFLLPCPGHHFLQNDSLETLSVQLHDPTLWRKNKWGLFHPQHSFSKKHWNAIEEFTTLTLKRAVEFHDLMNRPLMTVPSNPKPVLYLSAHGQPTMNSGIWLHKSKKKDVFLYYPEDFKKWRPDLPPDIVMGDGDKTVPSWSAELPEAYTTLAAKTVALQTSHLEALQGRRAQNFVHEFLLHDEP